MTKEMASMHTNVMMGAILVAKSSAYTFNTDDVQIIIIMTLYNNNMYSSYKMTRLYASI